MSNKSNFLPHEQTPEERAAGLAELKRVLRLPAPPVPEESIRLLYEAACSDTGGSQAARNFLFWLAGQADPTGYWGDGGVELRRLDHQLKEAAFQVMQWWACPTKSDMPLHEVLNKLRKRFSRDDQSLQNRTTGGDV